MEIYGIIDAVAVVRALRCKPTDNGFESGLYVRLWDVCHLADAMRQCISGVTGAESLNDLIQLGSRRG